MSHADRAMQCVVFMGLVSLFFCGFLPLLLGTIEQLLGLTGSRRR